MTDITAAVERLNSYADSLESSLDKDHPPLEASMRMHVADIKSVLKHFHFLKNLVLDGIDSARVLEWMKQPNRKPANQSFTAGGERQAAYLIEIAEAAMSAAVPHWQPIETAPKDGTVLLGLFNGKDHMETIAYNHGWYYAADGDSPDATNQPTHWMPLPPPPQPKGGE